MESGTASERFAHDAVTAAKPANHRPPGAVACKHEQAAVLSTDHKRALRHALTATTVRMPTPSAIRRIFSGFIVAATA
jgi:hypothetical protein